MRTTVTPEGDTTWHFTRAELTALLAHMSRDVTRPGMCSLILNADLGRAWVTDGYRAALLKTTDRVDADRAASSKDPVLIPRAAVEQAAKEKEGATFTRKAASLNVDVVAGGQLRMIQAGSDHPPNVDNAIPHIAKQHTGTSASFSGRYLSDVDLIVKACPPIVTKRGKTTDRRSVPVLMHPPADEYKPVTFIIDSYLSQNHWTVLIMPVAK